MIGSLLEPNEVMIEDSLEPYGVRNCKTKTIKMNIQISAEVPTSTFKEILSSIRQTSGKPEEVKITLTYPEDYKILEVTSHKNFIQSILVQDEWRTAWSWEGECE